MSQNVFGKMRVKHAVINDIFCKRGNKIHCITFKY